MNGKRYTVGKRLGGGGEGTVYLIEGDDGIVVKVYKEKSKAGKEGKLKAMLQKPIPSKVQAYVAWPKDVVYDQSGGFVGFIMMTLTLQRWV